MTDNIEDACPECVICMEPIEETTTLPCMCKVSYCPSCWDRSLASSLRSTLQATCPTCRFPVRVDFDAEKGRLVFQRETDEDVLGGDPRAVHETTLTRLLNQARPAQIKTLVAYGETQLRPILESPHAVLEEFTVGDLKEHISKLGGDSSSCIEKQDLVTCLLAAAGGPENLALYLASVDSVVTEAPKCNCGGALKRKFYSRGTSYICDICNHRIVAQAWGCEKGTLTIFHATEYDVCDKCFLKHACGVGDIHAKQQLDDTQ